MRVHQVALCCQAGGSSLTFCQVPSARRVATMRATVTDVADNAVQATASVHRTSGDFESFGGFLPVVLTHSRSSTIPAIRAAMVAATAE